MSKLGHINSLFQQEFRVGRLPRVLIPGLPHHVVQRGHDHKAVFVETGDYEYYLENLIEYKAQYNVAVYAYCLMTNHVHLILEPRSDGSAISSLMRRLSARQGRRVNRLERRIGTLWSGRFRCSVIETDRYLLACLRYVELNPVRAGMVSRPEDYRWSSYAQQAGMCDAVWIDAHPLGKGPEPMLAERRRAYREFVDAGVPAEEIEHIRQALRRNQLTGGARFIDEIERRTGIRVETRGRGRPQK
jgi:putative transposase